MFKHQDLQIGSQLKHTSNFHSLEAVGGSSETQLQVGEKLNKITFNFKG